MKTTTPLFLAAAAAALALSASSLAQNCGPGIGPCGGNGGYFNGPGMMGRGAGPGAYGDPAARAESRLETLRAALALQPAQQAAWNAYAAAVKAQAATMQEDRAAMRSDAGTAPERMARHAQLMGRHSDGHAKVAQALNDLYAALDAGQRAILDRNAGPGRGPGFGPMAGR
jgi:hypothetical protein